MRLDSCLQVGAVSHETRAGGIETFAVMSYSFITADEESTVTGSPTKRCPLLESPLHRLGSADRPTLRPHRGDVVRSYVDSPISKRHRPS